jgi:hypothetical protein
MKEMGFDTLLVKKKLDAGVFSNETACYKLLTLKIAHNTPKLRR